MGVSLVLRSSSGSSIGGSSISGGSDSRGSSSDSSDRNVGVENKLASSWAVDTSVI